MIVGTGNVGASIAYSLVNQRTAVNELVLTDINANDAEGEAMDLRDSMAVSPSAMKITSGGYDEVRGCDIVVIAAGVPQRPGETRMELLAKNAKILKPMIKTIMKNGFDGIFVVVSNPVDILTYLVWKYSGLPSNRIIGSGTVLDSARLRMQISSRLHVSPKSVHSYIVGEHGDTEFALWSKADIGGELINSIISKPAMEEIEKATKNEVYEIIKRKGSTHYGIGSCVTQIIQTILTDERRVLPVSSYDDETKIFYGFPTVIGRRGVYRRLYINMSEDESIKLQKSINALVKASKKI